MKLNEFNSLGLFYKYIHLAENIYNSKDYKKDLYKMKTILDSCWNISNLYEVLCNHYYDNFFEDVIGYYEGKERLQELGALAEVLDEDIATIYFMNENELVESMRM